MTIVAGISWNFDNKTESFYKEEHFSYDSLKDLHNSLISKNILNNKINNFGRISNTSKLYSLLTGLALEDIKYSSLHIDKKNIGLIACSKIAATKDNEKYYKDYVQAGKKMGRGNLFVYTLPTSPLGESAIAYQLKGPILFVSFLKNHIKNLLDHTDILISSKDAEGFITIFSDENGTLCFLLIKDNKNTNQNMYIPLEKINNLLNKKVDTISLVETLKKIR